MRPPVSAPAPTRAQLSGLGAERQARRLLEEAGLAYVDANVRYKVGELDLVMMDGAALVFIEVRMRSSRAFGGAAASVDHRKRLRLRRAANRYLLEHFGQRDWPACRFDVIAFEADTPNWIKGAFDAG
jgi:putative endonuclease